MGRRRKGEKGGGAGATERASVLRAKAATLVQLKSGATDLSPSRSPAASPANGDERILFPRARAHLTLNTTTRGDAERCSL